MPPRRNDTLRPQDREVLRDIGAARLYEFLKISHGTLTVPQLFEQANSYFVSKRSK
jgi:hypothetical protein